MQKGFCSSATELYVDEKESVLDIHWFKRKHMIKWLDMIYGLFCIKNGVVGWLLNEVKGSK